MTFQQYAEIREHSTAYSEGIIKAMFNAEYRNLPDNLRRRYDLMTPEAHAEVEKIKTGQQIPLAQAIAEYLASSGARSKLSSWKRMVPPERKVRRLQPLPYEFGTNPEANPGWKSYRP